MLPAPASRSSRPSPLEQLPLPALIADEHQTQALFDALDDLAAIRTATSGDQPNESAAQRRTRKEERIRNVVGPALLNLALGRNTEPPPPPTDDEVSPDDPDQAGPNGTGSPATVATSAPTGSTPATTASAAVEALERRRREHLQRRIGKLVERFAHWPLPAQLAAYRVVLILTAAGLWPHPEDWTPVIYDGLYNLWCAEEDDSFAYEHAALATIGLVAVWAPTLSVAAPGWRRIGGAPAFPASPRSWPMTPPSLLSQLIVPGYSQNPCCGPSGRRVRYPHPLTALSPSRHRQ